MMYQFDHHPPFFIAARQRLVVSLMAKGHATFFIHLSMRQRHSQQLGDTFTGGGVGDVAPHLV
jgi:hypothetical protein